MPLSKPLRLAAWSLSAALAVHAPYAMGGMIGPEAAVDAAAGNQADADRAKVQQFLERSNVAQRLQAMGVGALNARERVDALTPQEVHALAERIDSLPAGGRLSENDMILILLVAILVIVAL